MGLANKNKEGKSWGGSVEGLQRRMGEDCKKNSLWFRQWERIRFWFDNWCEQRSLTELFNQLINIVDNKEVAGAAIYSVQHSTTVRDNGIKKTIKKSFI